MHTYLFVGETVRQNEPRQIDLGAFSLDNEQPCRFSTLENGRVVTHDGGDSAVDCDIRSEGNVSVDYDRVPAGGGIVREVSEARDVDSCQRRAKTSGFARRIWLLGNLDRRTEWFWDGCFLDFRP